MMNKALIWSVFFMGSVLNVSTGLAQSDSQVAEAEWQAVITMDEGGYAQTMANWAFMECFYHPMFFVTSSPAIDALLDEANFQVGEGDIWIGRAPIRHAQGWNRWQSGLNAAAIDHFEQSADWAMWASDHYYDAMQHYQQILVLLDE